MLPIGDRSRRQEKSAEHVKQSMFPFWQTSAAYCCGYDTVCEKIVTFDCSLIFSVFSSFFLYFFLFFLFSMPTMTPGILGLPTVAGRKK